MLLTTGEVLVKFGFCDWTASYIFLPWFCDILTITVKKAIELFMLGLETLGMKRTVACVITFLKDQNERSSRDIEVATGLRQPEVCIAMQTLIERDWLTEHEIKSEGKGGPLKIYSLRATIDEIINYCEAEKSREFARTSEAIQRLKELSSE
jgi:predicted transcriptional regulator